MKNKFVGIKEFQAKLAQSFPQKNEVTTVTKRNVPLYTIANLGSYGGSSTSASFASSLSSTEKSTIDEICPTCGRPFGGDKL